MEMPVTKNNKRKSRQDVARVYDEYSQYRDDEFTDALGEVIEKMLRDGFTV